MKKTVYIALFTLLVSGIAAADSPVFSNTAPEPSSVDYGDTVDLTFGITDSTGIKNVSVRILDGNADEYYSSGGIYGEPYPTDVNPFFGADISAYTAYPPGTYYVEYKAWDDTGNRNIEYRELIIGEEDPSFNVNSPTMDDTYTYDATEDSVSIPFTGSYDIPNAGDVTVYVDTEGSSGYQTLETFSHDSGGTKDYSFSYPATEGEVYYKFMYSSDATEQNYESSTYTFDVVQEVEPPTILTAEATPQNTYVGEGVDYSLTAEDDAGIVEIEGEVRDPDNNVVETFSRSYTNPQGYVDPVWYSGSTSYLFTPQQEGEYTIESVVIDSNGITDSRETVVEAVADNEPVFSLNSPEDEAQYTYSAATGGASVDYNFSVSMENSGTVRIYRDNQVVYTESVTSGVNQVSYNEVLGEGGYTYYVEAEYDSGDTFDSQQRFFEITEEQIDIPQPSCTQSSGVCDTNNNLYYPTDGSTYKVTDFNGTDIANITSLMNIAGVGDVNNDGQEEIAGVRYGNVHFMYMNGTTIKEILVNDNIQTNSAGLEDIDRDGNLETIYNINTNNDNYEVKMVDFNGEKQVLATLTSPWLGGTGDVDGDNVSEVIATDESQTTYTDNLTVIQPDGTTRIYNIQSYSQPRPFDEDGDGVDEIFIDSGASGTVYDIPEDTIEPVNSNIGTFRFTTGAVDYSGDGTEEILVGDGFGAAQWVSTTERYSAQVSGYLEQTDWGIGVGDYYPSLGSTQATSPPTINDITYSPGVWKQNVPVDVSVDVSQSSPGSITGVEAVIRREGNKIGTYSLNESNGVYKGDNIFTPNATGVDYSVNIRASNNGGFTSTKSDRQTITDAGIEFRFNDLGTWSNHVLTPDYNQTNMLVEWDGFNSTQSSADFFRIDVYLDSTERELQNATERGIFFYSTNRQSLYNETSGEPYVDGYYEYYMPFTGLTDYDRTSRILGDRLNVTRVIKVYDEQGNLLNEYEKSTIHASQKETGGFFQPVFEAIYSFFGAVGDFISNPINSLIDVITDLIVGLLEAIFFLLTTLLSIVINIVMLIVTGVVNTLQFALFFHTDLDYSVGNNTYDNFSDVDDGTMQVLEGNISVKSNGTQTDNFNTAYGTTGNTLLTYRDNVTLYEYELKAIDSFGIGESSSTGDGRSISLDVYIPELFKELGLPFGAVLVINAIIGLVGVMVGLIPKPILKAVTTVFTVGINILTAAITVINVIGEYIGFVFNEGMKMAKWVIYGFLGIKALKYYEMYDKRNASPITIANEVSQDVESLFDKVLKLTDLAFNIVDKGFNWFTEIVQTIKSYIPFI